MMLEPGSHGTSPEPERPLEAALLEVTEITEAIRDKVGITTIDEVIRENVWGRR